MGLAAACLEKAKRAVLRNGVMDLKEDMTG
jgi:hypothetical protein